MAHECPNCGNDDPDKVLELTEPVEIDGRISYRRIGYLCAECSTLLSITVGAIEELDGPAAVQDLR